jgi:hypothetical protein
VTFHEHHPAALRRGPVMITIVSSYRLIGHATVSTQWAGAAVLIAPIAGSGRSAPSSRGLFSATQRLPVGAALPGGAATRVLAGIPA